MGEPKISIVNVWTDRNRGDAAIVMATVRAVKRHIPNAEIGLFTNHIGVKEWAKEAPGQFELFRKNGLTVYPGLCPLVTMEQHQRKAQRVERIFSFLKALAVLLLASVNRSWGAWPLSRTEKELYDRLVASDLIISKGGSYLVGNVWNDALAETLFLFPLVLGSLYGRSTLMLGVSVGPAKSALARWVMSFWLRRIGRVVVRESEAYKKCLELKYPERKLFTIPDMAFFDIVNEVKPPPASEALVSCSRPIIGVTVRKWDFDRHPDAAMLQQNYLQSVALALATFAQEQGGTVVLVPQCSGPVFEESDRAAWQHLQRVWDSRRVPHRCFSEDLGIEELRSVYAGIDLLVGTRLHSVILGFGTPTVIIGYQGDKSIGTARLLQSEDCFIHIDEVTEIRLLEKIRYVWAHREDLKQRSQSRRDLFREQFDSELPRLLST
jgi:polysaccharide pyruvyl transferase WcaK-like protein